MNKEDIIKKAKKIQGWASDEELGLIYDLAQKYLTKNSLALEVGSWKGKMAFVTASVCLQKGATLICLDTFYGCESQKKLFYEASKIGIKKFMEANIYKNLAGLPVKYIVGDSTIEHKQIKDGSISFCFIDGDHYNPVVKQDLDNFWPKVKIGGVFAGHDFITDFPHVIKEVIAKFPDLIQREIKFSIWLVKKEK